MRQHPVGLAAQQQRGQTAAAMLRHEDEVAVVVLGNVDDRLPGRIADHRQRGALDAGFLAELLDETQILLGLPFRPRNQSFQDGWLDQIAIVVRVPDRPCVQGGDAGVGRLGKSDRAFSGLARELAAIRWQQDMLEHFVLPHWLAPPATLWRARYDKPICCSDRDARRNQGGSGRRTSQPPGQMLPTGRLGPKDRCGHMPSHTRTLHLQYPSVMA